jgi:hypothetical protein
MPICDVILLGPRGRTSVRALVDSGAVYSVFPMKAAEDAGIILMGGQRMSLQYGGSTEPGMKVSVYLLLSGRRHRADVVFVERLEFPYGLLGRTGLFAQYNEVCFLERLKTPRVEFRL